MPESTAQSVSSLGNFSQESSATPVSPTPPTPPVAPVAPATPEPKLGDIDFKEPTKQEVPKQPIPRIQYLLLGGLIIALILAVVIFVLVQNKEDAPVVAQTPEEFIDEPMVEDEMPIEEMPAEEPVDQIINLETTGDPDVDFFLELFAEEDSYGIVSTLNEDATGETALGLDSLEDLFN